MTAAPISEAVRGDGTDDLNNSACRFWRFLDPAAEGVIGYAGLGVYGADALLRSVVVDETARGRRYGTLIVGWMLAEAAALGAVQVHLLTTTASGFFARLGFAQADRATAPTRTAANAEFSALCPASATYMTIPVDRPA
jgi:amino-acid N-acetyltransferase